jgi:chromatin remodeling complex protein RSC6
MAVAQLNEKKVMDKKIKVTKVVEKVVKTAEPKATKAAKTAEPKATKAAKTVEPKATKAAKTAEPKATKAAKTAEPKATKAAKAVKTDKPNVDEAKVTDENIVAPDQPQNYTSEFKNIKGQIDMDVYKAMFNEVFIKQGQINTMQTAIKNELKTIEKRLQRDHKVTNKIINRRKIKCGNRKPSGFIRPTRISDELANFLSKEIGSQMARTEVTKELNKYIVSNKLQDPENGRKINPDEKLTTLLKYKKNEDDPLTYFNLQRFMSPHFSKATESVPEVTAPETTA